jgi:hypothetical protein
VSTQADERIEGSCRVTRTTRTLWGWTGSSVGAAARRRADRKRVDRLGTRSVRRACPLCFLGFAGNFTGFSELRQLNTGAGSSSSGSGPCAFFAVDGTSARGRRETRPGGHPAQREESEQERRRVDKGGSRRHGHASVDHGTLLALLGAEQATLFNLDRVSFFTLRASSGEWRGWIERERTRIRWFWLNLLRLAGRVARMMLIEIESQ